MTTPQALNKPLARTAALFVVAAVHVVLAGLDVAGRTRYGGITTAPLLQGIADYPAWTWLHITAALILIAVAVRGRYYMAACSISFGVMFSWSLCMLLWAFTVTPPVSLAGPVLGMGVAGVTFALNLSWATD